MTLLIFKLIIIFLSFAGFAIAGYIHHTRKRGEELVCPIGSDCNAVVNSEYGYFAGIPTTLWGMVYYAGIAIFYAALIIIGKTIPAELAFIAFGISIVAVLFSGYLVAIQAFVLKNWCTWCLVSAGISVLILAFTVLSVQFDLMAILIQYKWLVVLLHAIAAAIGVGAVTVTDFFFFKFLKDYRISHAENAIMKNLSQLIWIALGLLILTGIGLYVPNAEVLNSTPKFIIKVILIGGLLLNGLLLNFIISPRLVHISFGDDQVKQPGELHHLRKLAFASGAFSILTWYSVFILGSIRQWPFTFWQIFGGYLILLLVAVIGSQIFDRLLSKKKIHL